MGLLTLEDKGVHTPVMPDMTGIDTSAEALKRFGYEPGDAFVWYEPGNEQSHGEVFTVVGIRRESDGLCVIVTGSYHPGQVYALRQQLDHFIDRKRGETPESVMLAIEKAAGLSPAQRVELMQRGFRRGEEKKLLDVVEEYLGEQEAAKI